MTRRPVIDENGTVAPNTDDPTAREVVAVAIARDIVERRYSAPNPNDLSDIQAIGNALDMLGWHDNALSEMADAVLDALGIDADAPLTLLRWHAANDERRRWEDAVAKVRGRFCYRNAPPYVDAEELFECLDDAIKDVK